VLVQSFFGALQGRPQKRGATLISYKVLQCSTKLLHTSIFDLRRTPCHRKPTTAGCEHSGHGPNARALAVRREP
jgi:hypothetical protein